MKMITYQPYTRQAFTFTVISLTFDFQNAVLIIQFKEATYFSKETFAAPC